MECATQLLLSPGLSERFVVHVEDVELLAEAADVVKGAHAYTLLLGWWLFACATPPQVEDQLRLPELPGVTQPTAELVVLIGCCWLASQVQDSNEALSVSEVAAGLAFAVEAHGGDGTLITADTVEWLEEKIIIAVGQQQQGFDDIMPFIQERLLRASAVPGAAAAAAAEAAAEAGPAALEAETAAHAASAASKDV